MSRMQVHYLPMNVTTLPECTDLSLLHTPKLVHIVTHLPETVVGLCALSE